MNFVVKKLTDEKLLRTACDATRTLKNSPSQMSLSRIYQCLHSPARTQLFWVEMYGIPTFVSTHIVRHKHGVEHFVQSNREDRGGVVGADRLTPVSHSMMINAEALINIARKRLCFASHRTTVGVVSRLRNAIRAVDPDLADAMVPECVARGFCPELQVCSVGAASIIRSYPNSWPVKQRALVAAELQSRI